MNKKVHQAWSHAQLDQIKELASLVPKSVDPNSSTYSYDVHLHTLLMCAAAHGSVLCCKYLLENGADARIKNFSGYNALHWAAYTGRTECVDDLLKAGVKLESKTEDGQTPLHIASRRGHLTFIQYILQKGADINAVNSDAWTAMHFAVIGNHRDVARYLLSRKIEYDSLDINLKTVNSLVEEYGRSWFPDIVDELGGKK